jgi:hypothetical protein
VYQVREREEDALPDHPSRGDLGHVDVVDPGKGDVRQVVRVRVAGRELLCRVGRLGMGVPEELGEGFSLCAVSL